MKKTTFALFASLSLFACGKKDAPAADPAAKPADHTAAAAAAPAKPVRKELLDAIAAADAAKDDDALEKQMEALDKVTEDLTLDDFKGAIAVAKKPDTRDKLFRAIDGKLDDKTLAEFVVAANTCKSGEDCQAGNDLDHAIGTLTPDQFHALFKLAKSNDAKRSIMRGVSNKLDPSLVSDFVALAADEDLGSSAQHALASVENDAALTKLVSLLDDHSRTDTVHSQVPELLSKYPNNAVVKAAVPKLEQMARKDAQGVGREAAANALVKIEGKAALPLLNEMAKGDSWDHTRAMATDLAKTLQ